MNISAKRAAFACLSVSLMGVPWLDQRQAFAGPSGETQPGDARPAAGFTRRGVLRQVFEFVGLGSGNMAAPPADLTPNAPTALTPDVPAASLSASVSDERNLALPADVGRSGLAEAGALSTDVTGRPAGGIEISRTPLKRKSRTTDVGAPALVGLARKALTLFQEIAWKERNSDYEEIFDGYGGKGRFLKREPHSPWEHIEFELGPEMQRRARTARSPVHPKDTRDGAVVIIGMSGFRDRDQWMTTAVAAAARREGKRLIVADKIEPPDSDVFIPWTVDERKRSDNKRLGATILQEAERRKLRIDAVSTYLNPYVPSVVEVQGFLRQRAGERHPAMMAVSELAFNGFYNKFEMRRRVNQAVRAGRLPPSYFLNSLIVGDVDKNPDELRNNAAAIFRKMTNEARQQGREPVLFIKLSPSAGKKGSFPDIDSEEKARGAVTDILDILETEGAKTTHNNSLPQEGGKIVMEDQVTALLEEDDREFVYSLVPPSRPDGKFILDIAATTIGNSFMPLSRAEMSMLCPAMVGDILQRIMLSGALKTILAMHFPDIPYQQGHWEGGLAGNPADPMNVLFELNGMRHIGSHSADELKKGTGFDLTLNGIRAALGRRLVFPTGRRADQSAVAELRIIPAVTGRLVEFEVPPAILYKISGTQTQWELTGLHQDLQRAVLSLEQDGFVDFRRGTAQLNQMAPERVYNPEDPDPTQSKSDTLGFLTFNGPTTEAALEKVVEYLRQIRIRIQDAAGQRHFQTGLHGHSDPRQRYRYPNALLSASP